VIGSRIRKNLDFKRGASKVLRLQLRLRVQILTNSATFYKKSGGATAPPLQVYSIVKRVYRLRRLTSSSAAPRPARIRVEGSGITAWLNRTLSDAKSP